MKLKEKLLILTVAGATAVAAHYFNLIPGSEKYLKFIPQREEYVIAPPDCSFYNDAGEDLFPFKDIPPWNLPSIIVNDPYNGTDITYKCTFDPSKNQRMEDWVLNAVPDIRRHETTFIQELSEEEISNIVNVGKVSKGEGYVEIPITLRTGERDYLAGKEFEVKIFDLLKLHPDRLERSLVDKVLRSQDIRSPSYFDGGGTIRLRIPEIR